MSENDVTRLENQLLQIRDMITRQAGQLSNISTTNVDLAPLVTRLEAIERKVEVVERKVPPLPTLIAAGVIVIGVLGLSYSDIKGLSKPITEAGKSVSLAAGHLAESTNKLITNLSEIQIEQKKFTESQSRLTKDVSSSLEKVGNFDTALSRLIAGIGSINANSVKPFTEVEVNPANDREKLMSMLGGIIGDSSPEMSTLIEAQRAFSNYDYEKARSLALKAKKIDKDQDKTVYDTLIAQTYYHEKKYQEAIGAFNEVLAHDPDNDSALNNIGSVYFALSTTENNDKEKKDY